LDFRILTSLRTLLVRSTDKSHFRHLAFAWFPYGENPVYQALGLFVVSTAGEAYDARVKGRNRESWIEAEQASPAAPAN
jgi:hypothetical protein